MVALLSSQSGASIRFRFAVNSAGLDKDWDFKLLASQYQDKEGTIHDVARHVKAGHALCAGLLGGKWRSKANVLGSQVILLDIDNSDVLRDELGQPVKGVDGKSIKIYKHQLTIEEALTDPFIRQHCALIYTTASHKPDWHKFRLVFVLPEYLEGADTVEACTRFLMQHLPHDPACKDASRVFYGNTKAEFPLINPHAVLPNEWVQQAREAAAIERAEYQRKVEEIAARRQQIKELSEAESWDIDQLVQQALSFIPPRTPGSGNYEECLQVLMALVNHYGATEAAAYAENWSPSIRGTTWNIHQKIKSFRRGGISIGTLFHIAKQYGFRFPEPKAIVYQEREPDSILYTQYVAQERERQLIERAQSDFEKIKKLITHAIATPQYVPPKVKRKVPKESTSTVTYVPGQLPTAEEYLAMGSPKIQCSSEHQKQMWQEASLKGWKHILDNSHPGLGKSHLAGNLNPKDLGVEKLIYQDLNHRNPSVASVEENFTDLPARNNGLAIDPTRQTPSGQPYRVRPRPGEAPDTEGNCHREYLFNAFREKNFVDVGIEDSRESPICEGCPLSNQCKFASGPGFGFRFEKREAIENSDRLRAHPDSTPPIFFKGEEEVYTVARIWEEPGALINTEKSVEVALDDFNQTIGHLALELPIEFEKLRPGLDVLRQFLSQELKPKSRYGFDDEVIRNYLPEFPADLNIPAIKDALFPNLDFLREKDGLEMGQQLKKSGAARYASRELEKLGARVAGKEFLDLPLYWLPDFLSAWKGDGSMRCIWGRFFIYTYNPKHKELTDTAKTNIYLDATLSPELLKIKLKIDEPILVVEQTPPDYGNLKIINVTGLGKLGKDRSETLTARVDALKNKLGELHPDLGILEWKAIATKSERIEYGHFVDGRGVNRFEHCSAIASFGIPYANIGKLAAEFQVETGRAVNVDGDDSKFQDYVTALVNAEIIQEIGRLRASRRAEEQLTFYLCADCDTDFLIEAFKGATIEQVDAFSITPDAGTDGQKTRWAILQAAKQLFDQGQKITQQALAKIGEISQPLVSKVSSQLGGWSCLKKLLLLLYESLYSDGNNFELPQDPDLKWLADSYLPLLADSSQCSPSEVETAILDVIETYGETVFKQALAHTPRRIKLRLVGQLLVASVQILPPTSLEFELLTGHG
ncbi:DNA primase [Scytonema sp. UIC 10036]|uniref:PriCT-2 domain-containing protein n=1 Tax=Scytonema sp. UIC 10036 TaxID=2304196 RepID=UPI0012DA9CC7|nr:PriCT-2 domain-containing protein [Scytonema sp. UIC 10036]MUH00631.1 DNA primase [Scytonema sp. UIC 10036]